MGFRRVPFPFAAAALKSYAVAVKGDTVTLTALRSRNIYDPPRGRAVWPKDELVGTLTSNGTIIGTWGKSGSFWLLHESMTSKVMPLKLKKGETHQLTCLGGKPYKYACHLPRTYDHSKRTPVLINDSGGGPAPPLSRNMAEGLGWIMVGLTETANDRSAQFNNEAYAAVIFDLRRRFNIHPKRFYFAGLSGGARSAAGAGAYYPDQCAGILCIGAGFLHSGAGGQYYTPPVDIPVFFLVGQTDVNHDEVVLKLYPTELKRKRPVKLVVHPGGHDWGRQADRQQAIQWLNAQWAETKTPANAGPRAEGDTVDRAP